MSKKLKTTTKSNMKDLLIQSQRVTGGRKPITVIDPSRLNEFFKRLADSDLGLQFKTLIAVSLSGGLRVSEALSVRPCDLDSDIIKIKVLKKKVPVYREFKLHPIAKTLLTKYRDTTPIKHFGKYFNLTRNQVYKLVRKTFGEGTSPHSIARHSHMSYLIHVKRLSQLKVARLMEVWPHVVASYNHLNTRKELKNIW